MKNTRADLRRSYWKNIRVTRMSALSLKIKSKCSPSNINSNFVGVRQYCLAVVDAGCARRLILLMKILICHSIATELHNLYVTSRATAQTRFIKSLSTITLRMRWISDTNTRGTLTCKIHAKRCSLAGEFLFSIFPPASVSHSVENS